MKLRLMGLLGWLVFCYLFLVFIKLIMARSLERFFFHWDAPLWLFLDCLIGAYLFFLVRRKFNLLSENLTSVNRDFLIFVATIPVVSLIVTFWGIVIVEKLAFGKTHTYYNWASEYLIDLITQSIVCLSCISYFYVTTLIKTQERLSAAQRAQSEMQLKLLQQQVDPHFLFNNLNVLSALVEKDTKIAGEFLTRLAELYRYILQTQNVEVVPVKDELAFAQNYLYLLKQRFGDAYDFDWQVPPDKINGQMIVPAALQGLLENVVKHNAGNHKKPLQIRIALEEEFLILENEISPKSNSPQASGTGLKNLSARFAFLAEQPLEITRGESVFKVKLPLLKFRK